MQVLNKLFACTSFVLVLVLASRLLNKKKRNKSSFIAKHHKGIGIIIIVSGFIHGILSEISILSLKMGTLTLIISILLGTSYLLRTKMKRWINIHKNLTIWLVIFMILHIVEVMIL